MKKLFLLLLLCFIFSSFKAYCQVIFKYRDSLGKTNIGNFLYYYKDGNGFLSFDSIRRRSASFKLLQAAVPNFKISTSVFWFRFSIKNASKEPFLYVDLEYPPLDRVDFFADSTNHYKQQISGTGIRLSTRTTQSQNHVFKLSISPGQQQEYYFRIQSKSLILVPLYIGSASDIYNSEISRNLIYGIYYGIIAVMILFNLFIFISVRDRNYFLYVIYILFVGLAQAVLDGYTYKYLWPESPWLSMQSMIFIPALTGIAVAEFFKGFLDIKRQIPSMLVYINTFNVIYILCIISSLLGYRLISLAGLQISAITGSFFLFYISLELIKKGYRPAKFFLLAWSFFLSSIIIFVLRNFNLLPFNSFTEHVLLIGSGAEVTLLSFALADRINILKQEKEFSQAIALSEAQKNEHLIRDQNINLEHMVDDRTNQLTSTMNDLQLTMNNLKNTQAQLVDSEKMASLGQLTAGIAHEINNPINFVTSNIKPLKRDINDLYIMLSKFENSTALMDPALVTEINQLKEELDLDYVKSEIDLLLKGIDEGAFRTSEIIRGLKMFARVDEQDIKDVNLNEGFESTLLLLNSKIKDKIKLQMKLGAIPKIECYAGKLNQVFMNIISNSIYAINQLHGDSTAGMLCIETKTNEENDQEVVILIQDNGTGMPEEIKQKIFDPFFTTKPIGEGTGLGLSIVQQIIISHKGTIDVQSEAEKGTLFKIILPVRQ